jgi:hypothetical protein
MGFTCYIGCGRGIIPNEIRRISMHRTSNRSERVKPQPFSVTFDQKAPRSLYVLLPRRFINPPKRKPWHMRQVMMHQMIVVVQEQLGIPRSPVG